MRDVMKYRHLFYMINRSIHYLPKANGYPNGTNLIKIDKNCLLENNNNNILAKSSNIFQCHSKNLSVSNVYYLKKGKKITKEQISKMKLDLREVDQYLDTELIIKEMKNAIEHMKENFVKNLTIRTNIGSIELLIVEFEGKKYQLQELVQIARKANFVILNVTEFPQAMPQILTCIRASGMNLNPQQDGTKISIPIPKVTKEHREELSKGAKAMFVKCRNNVKAVGNKHLQSIADDKHVSKEMFARIKHNLEMLAEKHVQEAENILNVKNTELLGS
ncbi:ribosome-recycling factor, mitochondrial [Leptopilina heterotoma]|uniref:ribosome-recycling factor, mitochondrial n=1 Tax=Leptopilina heterotoma TaxID=63436 RepID=UPI001CA7F183|nr:ribosome-recycling factor, mitochondrial [Leptopilina heterotoma]